MGRMGQPGRMVRTELFPAQLTFQRAAFSILTKTPDTNLLSPHTTWSLDREKRRLSRTICEGSQDINPTSKAGMKDCSAAMLLEDRRLGLLLEPRTIRMTSRAI